MREMRKLIVLMVFAFMSVATVTAATLLGMVKEASTGEALIQASVRVLAARDSSLVRGATTDAAGRFRIEGLKAGRYIVEASYVGFSPQLRPVRIADTDVTLKPFELAESTVMLNEAVVRGIRTPIKVMEDTVEYSAESYKTQPNAVVEDLLKRLPGVEVGSDGKITANGKEVTKILIEGKEFFADDPTVASRNLPVDMVEKLQVVDRKSDLARITGVDDGEDETVINLTVKKNMTDGWFGNAEAGYGTDDRYKASFTVNRFWKGNQLTFLGAANNINEPGFADGASGRFRRFGGTNGINSSQSFGVNFNVGRDEIFRVGGNVMYSHTDIDTRSNSDRRYVFTDSTSTTLSSKRSRDRGHNFRTDLRIQWKPDSFNTLDVRPNISLNYNSSASADTSGVYAGGRAPRQVRSSLNRSSSDGHSFELGARVIYNHNFRSRRGRSFSVMANYRSSNVRENSDSYSLNQFLLLDSIDEYDQAANNHTWNNNVSTRVSWTEPLGNVKKGHFLTLSYQFSYRWNNADKLTYDRVPVYLPGDLPGMPTGGYELVLSDSLSNRFRNDYLNQDLRLGYRHVTKNSNLNVGLSLVPQQSESQDLINPEKNIPRRSVLNFAPFLRYRYKMSKTRSLNMHYNGRSSQPSMSQLQPVPDYSNPMNIVIGNPNLDPSFTHNLMMRFQDFDSKAQRSIMAMMHAQYQQNAIVSRSHFNPETGGQTTEYRNVNGIWSARAMNMLSFPFRNKAWTFNNHLSVSYLNNIGYINGQRNRAGDFGVRENPGIAFRPDNFEFEIRPLYSLQLSTNSLSTRSDNTVHSYGGSFYGTYNTPVGIVLSTDLGYTATTGYSDGYNSRTWLWNATLSYEFLRSRNAAISLKAYDILGQTTNIRRTINASYIDDTRYNSLTRYVMVSFSYKFNTFGKGNQPQDRNAPQFGPGGPMGPPPGMRPGGPR